MRLTHGTGPAARELGGSDVAVVEDLKGVHQLLAEVAGAAALPGQGGKCFDEAVIALVGAEIGFDAPDAHDDGGVHGEAPLNVGKQGALTAIVLAGELEA